MRGRKRRRRRRRRRRKKKKKKKHTSHYATKAAPGKGRAVLSGGRRQS